jgi:glutamate dehydrogenase (NADP+)
MAQNAQHYGWESQLVEEKLFGIMSSIHKTCLSTAAECGAPGNYVTGANVAGFLKVAQSMLDQGAV